MKIEEFILLIIGVLIGTLFGLGFSDWGKVDPGSVTNWLIALGTLALVLIAIYSALSWKTQRIPEARKDLINAIVEFDNHIFLFNSKQQNIIRGANNLIDYQNLLLEKLWKIESSLMYLYQFDTSPKIQADKKYLELIHAINHFTDSATIYNHAESDEKLKEILPISYELLTLVVGKSLTIQRK